MLQINVLYRDFAFNSRGLLFPLFRLRASLAEAGYSLRFFRGEAPDLHECDVLIVDSKYHRDSWGDRADATLATFERWQRAIRHVLYFDTSDSSGTLVPALLPYVTLYCKSGLLRDRNRYMEPLYGGRLYTDFYHRNHGIADPDPMWSRPVADASWLAKLCVSWNTSLADWSPLGPLRMKAFRSVKLPILLRFPMSLRPASADRDTDVSCRMKIDYPRPTIGYQRKQITKLINRPIPTNKLTRRAYYREIQNSKVVVSPFAWGELTMKDYEALLAGALLFKPDMSHMETFPDLFRSGETMISHDWGLENFNEQLDTALENRSEAVSIAAEGQDSYRRLIATKDGHAQFVEHFRGIVERALARS